ncbi:trypsin-like peptidase domain-containing protein [Leptolyngbya sp. FACHB-36]|uniref:trypsin-like peptidase domain-containing protein n=1 Tax=Leptolyngbya sp. FACHB-36 TaxID=2692808 RepID=UPI00167FFBF8|nr:trypsin-like peptidase domain-containing protein [Leptolyngbya sp. FACHB-36]MBD2019282.1 trypsin-like peptidase domain-containing protein [Leptolyngbya sp. FACHB-36]
MTMTMTIAIKLAWKLISRKRSSRRSAAGRDTLAYWAGRGTIDDWTYELVIILLLLVIAARFIAPVGTVVQQAVQQIQSAAAPQPNGSTQIVALRQAIVGQESNGDPSLQNASGSGAMGLGQVMPENLPSWSREALGREITQQEFLSSPDLQLKIIDHKIDQYWQSAIKAANGNQDEAVLRVAAQWYSGDPEKYTSTTPQSWAGDSYPSIAEYSQQVLQRYKAIPQAAVSPAKPSASIGSSAPISSVVKIYSGGEIGSGVVVTPNRIATAAHVLKDLGQINIQAGDQSFTGRVIATDRSTDLAIVEVQRTLAPARLTKVQPTVGEQVTAIGNPRNQGIQATTGKLTSASIMSGVTHSAPIFPGSSGGGLFNDRGELIGINIRADYADPDKATGFISGRAIPTPVITARLEAL